MSEPEPLYPHIISNKEIPMWLDEGEIDQKLEKITALKSFIQGMGL